MPQIETSDLNIVIGTGSSLTRSVAPVVLTGKVTQVADNGTVSVLVDYSTGGVPFSGGNGTLLEDAIVDAQSKGFLPALIQSISAQQFAIAHATGQAP